MSSADQSNTADTAGSIASALAPDTTPLFALTFTHSRSALAVRYRRPKERGVTRSSTCMPARSSRRSSLSNEKRSSRPRRRSAMRERSVRTSAIASDSVRVGRAGWSGAEAILPAVSAVLLWSAEAGASRERLAAQPSIDHGCPTMRTLPDVTSYARSSRITDAGSVQRANTLRAEHVARVALESPHQAT